jgi:hypothetical protein
MQSFDCEGARGFSGIRIPPKWSRGSPNLDWLPVDANDAACPSLVSECICTEGPEELRALGDFESDVSGTLVERSPNGCSGRLSLVGPVALNGLR